ncbi:MAG: envelope stress response membrane protein PspB [Pseudomonadota bacterium]
MGDEVFVLGIIFLTVVAPLIIVLHFVTRWKKARELTRADETLMEEVWAIAQKLEGRIHVLETILDDEAPEWRNRV